MGTRYSMLKTRRKSMSNGSNYERPAIYQICIKGKLDPIWSDWFDGFSISQMENETVLTGPVPDQAALHGMLSKINDLGLVIISLNEKPEMEPEKTTAKKTFL
jgi:hypothetical protein